MKGFFRLSPQLDNKFFIVTYFVLITTILSLGFANRTYDDPFITYRYAHNLSQGIGPVYNPGYRVLSTTTPLLMLLLTPFAYFRADLPRVAILIGSISIALGGVSLWHILSQSGSKLAALTALLLYPTFPLVNSTLGSETPLYISLALISFAFYIHRRYSLTALFAALTTLARPDGILVPVIIAIHYLVFIRKPLPWKSLCIFLVVVLPWYGFAWLYYGTPLPVTLAAKQQQAIMSGRWLLVQGFLQLIGNYARRWHNWVEAALAFTGLIVYFRGYKSAGIVLAWVLLYITAYIALGVSRYYWYYAPLVPAYIILIACGLSRITDSTIKIMVKWNKISTQNNRLANPVWVFSLALVLILFAARISSLVRLSKMVDHRSLAYQAAGEWLKYNTPKDSLVGALEVGMIGYYSDRPMLDFAGLIQPDVALQLSPTTTYEDAAIWAITQYIPDYLVLHSGAFPRLEQEYAANQCILVETFPGSLYGYNQDLEIYACQE